MKKIPLMYAAIVLVSSMMVVSCASMAILRGSAEAVAGSWVSEDKMTPDLTRAEIAVRGERVYVHLWGACEPTDCDWGEESSAIAEKGGETLHLKWDQGFVVRQQTLTLLPDGRLEVSTSSVYNDSRAPRTIVSRFVRR
jgi:hypothetical protein